MPQNIQENVHQIHTAEIVWVYDSVPFWTLHCLLLCCSDVGNRITELNKVVSRLHTEMQEFHQKLQWRRKSVPDQANILGKYILGAKNNFRGFDKNEAMGYENTGLPISTHPAEEEDEDEKKGEIKAGVIVSEEEEEPVPGEETASTPDVWETNTAVSQRTAILWKIPSHECLDTFIALWLLIKIFVHTIVD